MYVCILHVSTCVRFPDYTLQSPMHAGTRTVHGSLIDLHVPMIQTIDEVERETDFDTNETSVLRANAHCCVYNVTYVGVFLRYSCHSV